MKNQTNVPLALNDFLYELSQKSDFLGSVGMVNRKSAFQFDIVVDGIRFTVYLVNNETPNKD